MTGSAALDASTSQGDLVAFSGKNFGQAPNTATTTAVTFKAPASNITQPCIVDAAASSDTFIVCRTGSAPVDIWEDLVFTVSTGALGGGIGDSSAQAVTGTDTYSYPTTPLIEAVSGCSPDGMTATKDCPPSGKDAMGNRLVCVSS